MNDAVVIEPKGKPKAAIIWLHGLGADGHDFEPIVPELGLDDHQVRFIFPHARQMAVTINAGMVMRAWFDIKNLSSLDEEVDIEGINQSINRISAIIKTQIAQGIPAGKIIVAGFSQGGVIALYTALQYPEPLAGILALSTFLPKWDNFKQQKHLANTHTPIHIAHGSNDPVVPFLAGKHMYETLYNDQYPVEFHHYPMQHQLCQEEIKMIKQWLKRILN